MATITAGLIKELRDKTGAGMMDCKNALKENDGDIEASIDWLRTKGIAKADKKSSRIAAEGLVGVASSGTSASMVEVNSETDFVARNDDFQAMVRTVASIAGDNGGDFDKLSDANYTGSDKSVAEFIKEMVGTIGENMSLRRSVALEVDKGIVASYIHNGIADGLGKIGVLVALESDGDACKLQEIGRQIAMHVAATSPLSLNKDELDPDVIKKERAVLIEQAKESGKPDNIIEKMVDGRMHKFFQEVGSVVPKFCDQP